MEAKEKLDVLQAQRERRMIRRGGQERIMGQELR